MGELLDIAAIGACAFLWLIGWCCIHYEDAICNAWEAFKLNLADAYYRFRSLKAVKKHGSKLRKGVDYEDLS